MITQGDGHVEIHLYRRLWKISFQSSKSLRSFHSHSIHAKGMDRSTDLGEDGRNYDVYILSHNKHS